MTSLINHSPADVVAQILIDMDFGSDPEVDDDGNSSPWPVSVGDEPEYPDNAITVYDTQGRSDARLMPDGHVAEHYGFQVRVRAAKAADAFAKVAAIKVALAKTVYQRIVTLTDPAASYVVQAITGIGDAIDLGKNTPNDKRSVWTLNALVVVRPA